MHIQGPAHLHAAQAINPPHRMQPNSPTPPPRSTAAADQLDISREADLVSRVRELPEIRPDKVAAIKAQIADGSYETDDKLNVALDRLLDELEGR